MDLNLHGFGPVLLVYGAIAAYLLAIIGVSVAVRSKQDPVTKFMWVFIILMMPFVGFLIWVITGTESPRQHRP